MAPETHPLQGPETGGLSLPSQVMSRAALLSSQSGPAWHRMQRCKTDTVPATWSKDKQNTQNLGSHRNPSVRTVMAGLMGTRSDSALGHLFHEQPWGSFSARQRCRCRDAASWGSPPRRGGEIGLLLPLMW